MACISQIKEYSLRRKEEILAYVKRALDPRFALHCELQNHARFLMLVVTVHDDVSAQEVEQAAQLVESAFVKDFANLIPIRDDGTTWSAVFIADKPEVYIRFKLNPEDLILFGTSGGWHKASPRERDVFGSQMFYANRD